MSRNNILQKVTSVFITLAFLVFITYTTRNNACYFPGWIVWESRYFSDLSNRYETILERKSVRIFLDSTLIWTSPEDMKVQDALSCDIDNDGDEELVLLCWKMGRYGRHRPFWVEEDERSLSQHIFVYAYTAEGMRPKWMSSYIGQDVAAICATDAGTSINRLWLTDPDGEVSAWKWDSWGFTKEDTDVSFTVFGDNLIHEPIYRYALNHDASFDFLFENVRDTIAQSDIAVINQETPFTDNPSLYSDYPRFGTPLSVGEAIADAGFDVVTCATNHALDKGIDGINTTKNFFDSQDIICLGIQPETDNHKHPYEIIFRNGIRFALFNYTYGTNGIPMPEENPYAVHVLSDEDEIRKEIACAQSESDCIIVFVHWGTENVSQPDDFQQKWTQVFLDCQVDIVVGTHPHTLQPYTVLADGNGNEMLIFYSIGNFISAQKEPVCTKGGMASFTVSLTPAGCKVTQYTLTPLTITWQDGGKYTVAVRKARG